MNEHEIIQIFDRYNEGEYDPETDPLAYERLMQELYDYQALARRLKEAQK